MYCAAGVGRWAPWGCRTPLMMGPPPPPVCALVLCVVDICPRVLCIHAQRCMCNRRSARAILSMPFAFHLRPPELATLHLPHCSALWGTSFPSCPDAPSAPLFLTPARHRCPPHCCGRLFREPPPCPLSTHPQAVSSCPPWVLTHQSAPGGPAASGACSRTGSGISCLWSPRGRWTAARSGPPARWIRPHHGPLAAGSRTGRTGMCCWTPCTTTLRPSSPSGSRR